MIILEQRTLASPSLFKHCFWGHFLGSWKNVRDSVLTRHIFCCHSVVNQWTQRFIVFCFLLIELYLFKQSLSVKLCFNKYAVSMLSCHTKLPRASTSPMALLTEYVAVKVFLLELLVCRMLMWEHFPQHLYTVNIAF